MKAKKFLSVLLALIMAVTTMAVFAVSASAEGVPTAKNGKTYTATLSGYGTYQDFKIKSSESGKLKIKVTSPLSEVYLTVLNSDGKELFPKNYDNSLGSCKWQEIFKVIELKWNSAEKKYKGTITYEIEKGNYYIRFKSYGVSGKLNFKPTFPSSDSSSDVKINNFTVSMKVGDTLQLDADLSDKTDDNVTWKSSKTSVAKVSATGKITAQGAGTATITASIGDSTLKIKVKVTK